MRRPIVPCLCVCCLLLCGCQAVQVAHDGESFRHALLDMYTDQAFDNLIRAREGLPFVQLAYRDLLVQDTDTLSGGANAGWSEAAAHGTSGAGVFTSISRMFGHTFSLSETTSRAKIMSFYADPVTTENDVYETYLTFASDPNLLMVCDSKPGCAVICRRQCGHKWYFVPVEAGPAFQSLVLKTSMLRGPETAPPGAYEVQITALKVQAGTRGDSVVATLTFNADVPNSVGLMVFKLDGRTVKIPVAPIFTTEDNKPIDEGAATRRLEAQWSPKLRGAAPDDLLNKKVRIYSYLYPPEAPLPSPVPQRVLDALGRIRANQTTSPTP
jgi:hypothetical protein